MFAGTDNYGCKSIATGRGANHRVERFSDRFEERIDRIGKFKTRECSESNIFVAKRYTEIVAQEWKNNKNETKTLAFFARTLNIYKTQV